MRSLNLASVTRCTSCGVVLPEARCTKTGNKLYKTCKCTKKRSR